MIIAEDFKRVSPTKIELRFQIAGKRFVRVYDHIDGSPMRKQDMAELRDLRASQLTELEKAYGRR